MNIPIKRIAIVNNIVNPSTLNMERSIYEYVARHNVEAIPYDSTDTYWLNSTHIPTLFISIGGDGTMLYTVKESIKFSDSSIVGISAGHLNFLNDQYDPIGVTRMIKRILNGDPTLHLDERMLVRAHFGNSKWFYALNEIFLTPPSMISTIRYDVDINGKHLATQSGSGVLVSTPTGSTAMSMSAGGSIMSPTSCELQIVPVASHSLTSRPVVVSGKDKIKITTTLTERFPRVELIGDGQSIHTFGQVGDVVTINVEAADKVARIWRPDGWNFFNVLSEKMGWDR